MRILISLLVLSAGVVAAPFELKDGDRVLLLGDALLERENTYGLLETRMHEQFPNVKFTVRNLSWSGETPKGWSRASFDGPEKGWERLKEQIGEVKPTVAILGFGMAASLQEMTDRSGDQTLNPDPVRYGAEPMSAARFKKELSELMDAITERTPDKKPARFVLLSPIHHEDLRQTRPGLPDPAAHNALLDQYSKVIEELAKERGVRWADVRGTIITPGERTDVLQRSEGFVRYGAATDNGINLNHWGYEIFANEVSRSLEWSLPSGVKPPFVTEAPLTSGILRKNDLFFHQFRPANSTYLFGFRKHEQGKNAAEMPKFTPLIEAADAEIDQLKRQKGGESNAPKPKESAVASVIKPEQGLPHPNFSVADGLEITLWADTNLVGKPVGMNWDAQGRLWVACSPVYPQITPGGHPDDKVVVLEDTDRDGKADKSTNFATNFLIAAGVAPDFGTTSSDANGKETLPKISAAYVGASTELIRVEDTDGDGIGDQRRIVLSGFGTEDTHHTIHTLRWGPDGRLYFNQSIYIHSHMETPWGMVRLNSGGICAYDPRTERVEVFARGFINTWGHAWDQWGQSFATDGAGFEGLHWVIPGAMYRTYEGARRILPSISPGTYPKYCGLELIQSPLFPADWQGNAITCDFRAHRLTRFQINDLSLGTEGKEPLSGYITKELPNPVTTTDTSFRPIDVKLGPDGALYIADWTNPIINHGEVDFRDPRRDHVNGRIWRLAPKGKAPLKWASSIGKKAKEVAHAALSKNAWEGENALRVLERIVLDDYFNVNKPKAGWTNYPPLDGQKQNQPDTPPTDFALPFKDLRDWIAQHKDQLSHQLYRAESKVGGGLFTLEGAPDKLRVRTPATGPSDSQDLYLHDTYYVIVGGTIAPALKTATDPRLRAFWTRETGETLNMHVAPIRDQIRKITVEQLAPVVRDQNPRVRLEAMRALARIPSVESVPLLLEAALNVPGGAPKSIRSEDKGTNQFNQPTFADTADPYYGYAAWLSINELDDVFLKALADGKWKPDTADRQKQLAWAVGALRPEKSGKALGDFIAKNGLPKDGAGPWIELIGQAGEPGELRLLLDGLLANTIPDGDNNPPLADAKLAFTTKEANRRAAAALVAGARRGAKPANPPYGGWQFHMYAPEEAINDVIRLAGLWKQDVAPALIARIDRDAPKEQLDAIFESLRTLGTDSAAKYLTAFLEPRLAKQIDNQFLNMALEQNTPTIRRRALTALAAFRPDIALGALRGVLDESGSDARLWRDLFSSDPFAKAFVAKVPQLTREQATPALRAARELGKRGEKLVAALTPLAGETAAPQGTHNIAGLIDMTKKNGNPVEGEVIYRRAALTCTVCHAIGGAGGKVGPDLGTIGASAPIDYIIESTVDPAAKVKEGFHAIAVSTKDGRTLSGTVAKESDTALTLRDMTGAEQNVEKSAIKERTNIGSLMPAGLTQQLNDREKANLFAFMAQLGKPGPFDASKATVARTWRVYPGDQVEQVVAGKADPAKATPVHSLVDGRVTKELMDLAIAAAGNQSTLVATARFSLVNGGQHRLHLAGITKAWLNGAPLAIASDPNPVVDLPAGEHTLVVKLDTATLPAHFRAECPDGRFLTD